MKDALIAVILGSALAVLVCWFYVWLITST